jgi:four helix bundle protein
VQKGKGKRQDSQRKSWGSRYVAKCGVVYVEKPLPQDYADRTLTPETRRVPQAESFQIAHLCYDVTVRFCDRYIDRRSRMRDQMVQTARSGVQNIAEGSLASATSKEMELKLTNVARASLGELRLDYEDYLR